MLDCQDILIKVPFRLMADFGDEIFLLPRPLKKRTDISVSWAYPNSYSIGLSGLGYQLVWWLFEQEPDVDTCRVFTDVAESGWESADLLGFTLSWELDYTNILSILNRAGVPLLARDRTEAHPIVFGGGPVLSANPEPFAEFFDVILLGDAELTVPALVEAFRHSRGLKSRKERLEQFAAFPGLYVPSLYSCVYESSTGPLLAVNAESPAPDELSRQAFSAPENYLAHSVILSPQGGWGDMFLLELVRSCPQECRFCLASYLTRPFRGASVDTVLAKVKMAMKHTKRVGIIGPSVTEHPRFSEIASELMKIPELRISVASIRMDSIDPLLLQMLGVLGQRSVTIALESGSERLRRIMKKNLSQEEIERGMEIIAASAVEQVKFYGMVGLPGESFDDLDETVRLLSGIKKKHRRLRIVFGVSSFVPKAQTPYQWCARARDCAVRFEYLRKRLAGLGVDVRGESSKWSDIQTLLSRGDRRLAPVLVELAGSDGKLGAWRKALRENTDSIPPSDFYIFREIPPGECLPWSHLIEAPKKIILSRQKSLSDQILAGAH